MVISKNAEQRKRICFVVSAPETVAAFLSPHIRELVTEYDIDVVANIPNPSVSPTIDAVHFVHVAVERPVRPAADASGVLRLWSVFRQGRYDIVQSVTPKAGLLAMVAAAIAGVPSRIHWFTGQVWATKRGPKRRTLRMLDRLTARLATRVLVDSPSQLEFLLRERVVRPEKATVLGSGSICGVDTSRFRPDPSIRGAIRSQLDVNDESHLLLYVGRINTEKGIPDLVVALQELVLREPRYRSSLLLALAGTDEDGLIPAVTSVLAAQGVRCIYLGHTDHPEQLMAAADLFCMPSHREGFGLSVIEAAACGIPAVASDIYGLTDAVIDGKTGLLFPVGNATAMASRIHALIDDVSLREQLGAQARERVEAEFNQHRLTSALQAEYRAVTASAHGK